MTELNQSMDDAVPKLTRLERLYLSRRACRLCDQRLDRSTCLAIHGLSMHARADARAAAEVSRTISATQAEKAENP